MRRVPCPGPSPTRRPLAPCSRPAQGQTLSVTFTPTDTADYAATSATVSINVARATPTITWANPAGITNGTALGLAQLDATASVPGTFSYTPAAGTVLKAGAGQVLEALFTPTDLVDFTTASALVTIDVAATTPTPLGPLTSVNSTTSNKQQVTAVSLTFDVSIDSSAASSPATYQLVKQGKHGLFIDKGKAKIKIKSVSYDPSNQTVTLIPRKPFVLSKPVEVADRGQAGGDPVTSPARRRTIRADAHAECSPFIGRPSRAGRRCRECSRSTNDTRIRSSALHKSWCHLGAPRSTARPDRCPAQTRRT